MESLGVVDGAGRKEQGSRSGLRGCPQCLLTGKSSCGAGAMLCEHLGQLHPGALGLWKLCSLLLACGEWETSQPASPTASFRAPTHRSCPWPLYGPHPQCVHEGGVTPHLTDEDTSFQAKDGLGSRSGCRSPHLHPGRGSCSSDPLASESLSLFLPKDQPFPPTPLSGPSLVTLPYLCWPQTQPSSPSGGTSAWFPLYSMALWLATHRLRAQGRAGNGWAQGEERAGEEGMDRRRARGAVQGATASPSRVSAQLPALLAVRPSSTLLLGGSENSDGTYQ